jgi:hypothetical protein
LPDPIKTRPAAVETGRAEDLAMPSWHEVFLYFLMLGFVNIGGPVAQITLMYNHMVERNTGYLTIGSSRS